MIMKQPPFINVDAQTRSPGSWGQLPAGNEQNQISREQTIARTRRSILKIVNEYI